jgi:hypothetical protein
MLQRGKGELKKEIVRVDLIVYNVYMHIIYEFVQLIHSNNILKRNILRDGLSFQMLSLPHTIFIKATLVLEE